MMKITSKQILLKRNTAFKASLDGPDNSLWQVVKIFKATPDILESLYVFEKTFCFQSMEKLFAIQKKQFDLTIQG